MKNDLEYYGARALQERQAALQTADSRARDAHTRLAEAYELKVRNLTAEARRSTIHLVTAA